MKFRSKATKDGRCAYAACQNSANKIYEDGSWRILACSLAHAEIARSEIDKIPPEEQRRYFK